MIGTVDIPDAGALLYPNDLQLIVVMESSVKIAAVHFLYLALKKKLSAFVPNAVQSPCVYFVLTVRSSSPPPLLNSSIVYHFSCDLSSGQSKKA